MLNVDLAAVTPAADVMGHHWHANDRLYLVRREQTDVNDRRKAWPPRTVWLSDKQL